MRAVQSILLILRARVGVGNKKIEKVRGDYGRPNNPTNSFDFSKCFKKITTIRAFFDGRLHVKMTSGLERVN